MDGLEDYDGFVVRIMLMMNNILIIYSIREY